MIFRQLDDNHDWVFGAGMQNFTTGTKAIALNIQTRILSWRGDCFWNMLAGIDWINRLGNKNQAALLSAELRRLILQSYGVTGLQAFDTVTDGRAFTVTTTVNTETGQTTQATAAIGG